MTQMIFYFHGKVQMWVLKYPLESQLTCCCFIRL